MEVMIPRVIANEKKKQISWILQLEWLLQPTTLVEKTTCGVGDFSSQQKPVPYGFHESLLVVKN